MYQYVWDAETGGLLLTTEQSRFSKEPRPVYSKELDILGFDTYWTYPKDDSAPLLWAEANNYIYKGKTVAKTKGGSLYTKPEIILMEDPEPNGVPLAFVDIEGMCQKNRAIMETLVQETIQKIYNTYREYRDRIDVFYVAFSGGKDSIVALDLVQRALPHDEFKVLFGDTRMEFPDTYDVIKKVRKWCTGEGIDFLVAQSKLNPSQTWRIFGPPATSNRWCCSVHKTSPQITLLRKNTGKYDFTGMAFTGIRAAESLNRSEYDTISKGEKHTGQYSCHGILEWNSAELFLYIYSNSLLMNSAYIKGNARVGCLVCPNSSGKHDYIKHHCYSKEVDDFLAIIASTSSKADHYSKSEMQRFIDSGYWRTRRSGKSLNFGPDLFEVHIEGATKRIEVNRAVVSWEQWGKTIGELVDLGNSLYGISYREKIYRIVIAQKANKTVFSFPNCENSKDDIKFFSLFRSVIVKALYCVSCGVCEAECKHNCIHMERETQILDSCKHCYSCHNVHEHCVRYNSIRNINSEGKGMIGSKKISGYDGHGPRAEWLASFVKHQGGSDFWNTDGDGTCQNKKKDKFRDFLKDAGVIAYDKTAEGDKYTKYIPTHFGKVIIAQGAENDVSWALMLCNLVYEADFYWYVTNLNFGITYTPDSIKLMLQDVMPNDDSGHGKSNVVDAIKIALAKTPLGTSRIFAYGDIDIKVTSSGRENLTLRSLTRSPWSDPVPEVVLYALYKFAEACEGYYQFSLETLLDDSIEREGISPTRIFGLDKNTMVRILNGLTINYPDFISASFTLDLDNITLREDKTAEDVLSLF